MGRCPLTCLIAGTRKSISTFEHLTLQHCHFCFVVSNHSDTSNSNQFTIPCQAGNSKQTLWRNNSTFWRC